MAEELERIAIRIGLLPQLMPADGGGVQLVKPWEHLQLNELLDLEEAWWWRRSRELEDVAGALHWVLRGLFVGGVPSWTDLVSSLPGHAGFDDEDDGDEAEG